MPFLHYFERLWTVLCMYFSFHQYNMTKNLSKEPMKWICNDFSKFYTKMLVCREVLVRMFWFVQLLSRVGIWGDAWSQSMHTSEHPIYEWQFENCMIEWPILSTAFAFDMRIKAMELLVSIERCEMIHRWHGTYENWAQQPLYTIACLEMLRINIAHNNYG